MQPPTLPDVQGAQRSLTQALAQDDGIEAMAPIRAGMRARAIANACEALGLCAILVDERSRVLHAGQGALALMGDRLRLVDGHLVGDDRPANVLLQKAFAAALDARVLEEDCESSPIDTLTLTGLPFRDPSPFQLLRGVLVVGRAARPQAAEMEWLRKALAASRAFEKAIEIS